MKNYRLLFLSCCLTILSGCAAFGVPYTSDPLTKLSYSYTLMNQGRPLPAEKLANEALESFTKDGNTFGMADVHIFFGQLYKHSSYRSFSKYYEEQGEYDPTNGKAIFHSQEAVELFESIGNFTQTAKAKFALANAYLGSNNEKACLLYDETLEAYEKGKTVNPGDSFQFNQYYKTFEGLVEAFKGEYCVNPA